jgi:hypothetical protein
VQVEECLGASAVEGVSAGGGRMLGSAGSSVTVLLSF